MNKKIGIESDWLEYKELLIVLPEALPKEVVGLFRMAFVAGAASVATALNKFSECENVAEGAKELTDYLTDLRETGKKMVDKDWEPE